MISLFKSNQEIIADIHQEFDTAQERILDQAEKLLQELKIPLESEVEQKAKRLEAVGFTSAIPVKQAETIRKRNNKIQEQFQLTKEVADLLKYYQQTYPFSKFLPESELDRICQKYNLIHAPVANYKMDVPEKNLRDIEQRQLLTPTDQGLDQMYVTPRKSSWSFENEKRDRFINTYGEKILLDKINTTSRYDLLIALCRHLGTDWVDFPNSWEISEVCKQGLFIAAPKNEFNLEGLKKEGKFGFKQIFERKIEDPIVFEYCRGGMIRVITKWGLEAEDQALINEKLN